MAHDRPREAQQTTLGALIDARRLEVGDGYRAKNEELGGCGLLFLRSGHITESGFDFDGVDRFSTLDESTFGRKISQPGDVVVTTKGWSTGRVAYVLPGFPRFVYSPHLSYWRSLNHSAIAPAFLRQWSRSPECQCQLDSIKMGIDIHPYLSLATQRRLRISLPDIQIQDAVAEVLGALDDKIELSRLMNETLETMARALFKSWFVDFGPVRAKAKGRAPTGMDAATAAVFPDGFEESELGEIPRGWKIEALREHLDLDKGVSYKGEFLSEAGVPMVNLGCFKGDGAFDPARLKGYAGEVRERHWVAPGDLVIANTDMTQNRVVLGSPGLVPAVMGHSRAVFSHHVYAARFKRDPTGAVKLFCYYALLQPDFRRRAAGFASGTTVLALPRDAVLDLTVVMPPAEAIERFRGACTPWLELNQANDAQSDTLAALRDALLPKLLSGELRVRDAAGIVERAV